MLLILTLKQSLNQFKQIETEMLCFKLQLDVTTLQVSQT